MGLFFILGLAITSVTFILIGAFPDYILGSLRGRTTWPDTAFVLACLTCTIVTFATTLQYL